MFLARNTRRSKELICDGLVLLLENFIFSQYVRCSSGQEQFVRRTEHSFWGLLILHRNAFFGFQFVQVWLPLRMVLYCITMTCNFRRLNLLPKSMSWLGQRDRSKS